MAGVQQLLRFHIALCCLIALLAATTTFVLGAEIRHKTVPISSPVTADPTKKEDGSSSKVLGRSIDEPPGAFSSSVEGEILTDNIQEESQGVRGYHGNEYESEPIHVATYATGSSSSNPLTVIALTVFGLLSLLILLQLLGVQTRRSMGSSTPSFSLPFEWNFNSEMIPQIMTKVLDWIEGEKANGGALLGRSADKKKKRGKRELSQAPGLTEWVSAYRKDPYEYECIRKLACETLAHSPLIAKSMKSQMGSNIMSSFKFFFDDGTILVETIKDILEDPAKCSYLFTDFICNDEDEQASTTDKSNKL